MFLDPPYHSPFSDYGYCVFDEDAHVRLAECFKNTSIRCLMIIGKTPFIEEKCPSKSKFEILSLYV